MSQTSEESSLVSRVMSRRFYQRTIPIFIVSVLTGIFIAEYFVSYEPLRSLKEELTTWSTIISLFVLLYGNVVVFIMNSRRLATRRTRGKDMFKSVCFIGSAAFFAIIAFASGPKFTSGALFTLVWTVIYGTMGIGIALGSHTFFTWHAIRRLISVTSLDAIVLLVSTVFSLFSYMTSLSVVFPQLLAIADWIKAIPNTASQRSALAAAAVGGIILGVRAIVGKEPGLIEREM